MQQMTFKEKIQWFIDYYALKTVIGIIAVVVVGLLLKSVFFPKPVSMEILIFDDRIDIDCAANLKNEVTGQFPEVVSEGEIQIINYIKLDRNQADAFGLHLGADSIDILIVPEDEMTQLVENEYWINPELISQESIYYKYRASDDGVNMYIGIPNKCKNPERAKKVIKYING